MLALRIQWTRTNEPNNPIIITDAITANINKSTEIKNNLCNLTLRNSLTKFRNVSSPTVSDRIGTYINSSDGSIMFGQDDEIRVWADYLSDANDVGSTWWNDNNLLGAFQLQENQLQTMDNSHRLQLSAVDIAFLLFNKVHTFAYGTGNNFTSPGIIRHICRLYGEAETTTITTNPGTQHDVGTDYAINAKFLSENGYIKDYRTETGAPSTTLNGALDDSATTITVTSTTGFEDSGTIVIDSEHIAYTGITSTTFTGCIREIDETKAVSHNDTTTVYQGFPLIVMNKIWRPLFEWIGEMSQTPNLNYLDEVQEGGTLFYNRAFMFWVDKDNNPHWFYPDNIVDQTVELAEEGRRAFKLGKSVFDAVNFIVFNAGEDMYSNGITYYLFDQTSDLTSMKMRYQPMTKIVHELIEEDLKVNTSRDTSERDIYKQFPSSYSPAIVPSFINEANKYRASIGSSARANVNSDSEYNDCLREAAKWRGVQEAKKITTKRSGLRYKGQLVLKGAHLNPGDLIEVTNGWIGLDNQLLRVVDLSHRINGNSWETTVQVEEDEKTLT